MKLWHKVTVGLVLGVILGVVVKEKAIYVKPVGDIFINLIKMVVVPLVYFSLVQGITSMSDPSSLGRVGIKASIAFITTTVFAVIIGLSVALIMRPGDGVLLQLTSDVIIQPERLEFDVVKLITNIVPDNVVASFSRAEMLQVVFFAIFTGVTLNTMSGEDRRIIEIFHMMSKLVFKMIGIVINFSPYGAFALTAWVVGTQGLDVLNSLAKLVFAVVIAMLLQYLIFGVFIKLFARMSPLPFYKKSIEYQTLAFSTSSSKAALATTIKVCREKLGISEGSTSFILPLGASINMDGMAIYLGMCAVFFAQATGVQLSPSDYVMVVLTSTLGSIGAAGIPGGSMVMLPMILASVGLPIEGVALIAGIDRILDMLRTTLNITGDATITLIVDKTEGTLNEELYNDDTL